MVRTGFRGSEMTEAPCPQVPCRCPTLELFVEEGGPNDSVLLYPVSGARWCPEHGITELRARAGRSGPVHLGQLVRAELNREFAERGTRVWRSTLPGEPSEIVRTGTPKPAYRLRVGGVRWDRGSQEIVPLRDLGPGLTVRPESVNRDRMEKMPAEAEASLERRDAALRPK